jgi:hypothetical protein
MHRYIVAQNEIWLTQPKKILVMSIIVNAFVK